jgi:hypothetical protein
MSPQSIPDKTQASCDFEDHSFHTHTQRAADDSTGMPIFPAEEAVGDNFTPFNVEYRDFHINILPPTPLELFQLFIPPSLTQCWIKYTNA